MEMKSVQSSNIDRIGHHGGAVYVVFKNGAIWKYSGVSEATYDEFKAAESIGSYFARHIKPHHAAEKVEKLPE